MVAPDLSSALAATDVAALTRLAPVPLSLQGTAADMPATQVSCVAAAEEGHALAPAGVAKACVAGQTQLSTAPSSPGVTASLPPPRRQRLPAAVRDLLPRLPRVLDQQLPH